MAERPELTETGTAGPAGAGAAETGSGPSAERGRAGAGRWLPSGFLAPALVLLGLLVAYPILFTIWRSLFDAGGDTFVGLDNYVAMFTDSQTFTALKNNLIWVLVAPALVTSLGLIFAVLTERVRWATAFRLVVFMPMAISMVAAGVIFTLVYDRAPERGLLNAVVVGVHDVFADPSPFPGARPRDTGPLATRAGAYETRQQARPGQTVTLPLVAITPQRQRELAPARSAQARPGALTGTVWADFTPGAQAKANQIDPTEKGLGGITVEAVSGGRVAATATTAADGTFTFTGLADGAYTVRLPAGNFAQPYNGVNWLGPSLVTPAIIASYVWMWAGFAMVLIGAGLAAIPRDALEAARVDGATEWQVFRRVTMPLLAPVLMVVMVTLVINVLKIFDLIYIIAPGSSQEEANVLALQMYLRSFVGERGDQGLGSAIAVVLLLLVLPAMMFNIRRFRREQG
ncbi:sugar ABC transporter permease [Actinomadura craniellae]|uniref:Sugar ABC transporter permease n=1 Tax=Actinomadura craniellae TaxID=2231787 RepID=A0A365H4H0_9ACTN|nr:sugar ABC transporter permease [Actinomadura craniellae]RAY13997.1 sugar ABC transporter permease [Actinomadura craniellae]